MTRRDGDKWLVWGFVTALVLHTAAVAAGTRLSAIRVGNGELDSIRVFDSRARVIAAPVELVSWPDLGAVADASLVAVPAETPAQPQLSPPKPAVTPSPREASRPASAERPAPRVTAGRRAERAPAARDRARPAGRSTGPAPGGGGGGGFAVGSPSPAGDLTGLPVGGGGTATGQTPGVGTGSGPGVGPGEGGGAGGGTGGGLGEGRGSGSGAGDGRPEAGSSPEGGERPFVSRLADRKQPEVISKGTLTYPPSALEEGVEGTVQLKVLVSEEGRVESVEVIRSSGDRRLDMAAQEFVRGWRYRPAVQDGKPRRVYSVATVVFELR